MVAEHSKILEDSLWPDCSEADYSKWPNNICAMLMDIKRYRFQMSDPKGYKESLKAVELKASQKKIKGSAEGGRSK